MNEPVKVGQVRQTERGPAVVEPHLAGYGRWKLSYVNGSAVGFGAEAVERMPLLCPAPEDRRNGDLYRQTEGVEMMYMDHRAGEPWADRCLSRGWRIIARGPEKAPAFSVETTVRFDPAKTMQRDLYPDNMQTFASAIRATWVDEAADFIVPLPATQAALSTPKADPAPFLPGTWVSPRDCDDIPERDLPAWLVVGAECPDGGRWFIAIQSDYGAERYYRWPGDIIPAPSAVRGHAIRRWNRATIEAARETPPRAVTSFGQRKGEAWERYQRQLAGLLERASGAEPWLIGSGHVADLLREAL